MEIVKDVNLLGGSKNAIEAPAGEKSRAGAGPGPRQAGARSRARALPRPGGLGLGCGGRGGERAGAAPRRRLVSGRGGGDAGLQRPRYYMVLRLAVGSASDRPRAGDSRRATARSRRAPGRTSRLDSIAAAAIMIRRNTPPASRSLAP